MIYDEENNSCIVYREERLKDDGTQRLVSFYNNHPCCECDVVIGKMDSEAFLKFTKQVQKYAERQIKESKNPLMYWGNIIQPSKNKWELCLSLDWIGALFKCLYIHKIMDWENNYILFEIG